MFCIPVSKTIATSMAAQAVSPTEKTDIWSLVNKCVFCHTMSNGKHKLLQCLHIVCKPCLEVKKTESGKYVKIYLF